MKRKNRSQTGVKTTGLNQSKQTTDNKDDNLLNAIFSLLKLPYTHPKLILIIAIILTGGVAALLLSISNNNVAKNSDDSGNKDNNGSKLSDNKLTLFNGNKVSYRNFSVLEGDVVKARRFIVAEQDHINNEEINEFVEAIALALGDEQTLLFEGDSDENDCEKFGVKSAKGRKCLGWEDKHAHEKNLQNMLVEYRNEMISNLKNLIHNGFTKQMIDAEFKNAIITLQSRIAETKKIHITHQN